MIRKWLKKLIIDAVSESFPPMHITLTIPQDTKQLLTLENCFFRESKIKISKELNDLNKDVKSCTIHTPKEGYFFEEEGNEDE